MRNLDEIKRNIRKSTFMEAYGITSEEFQKVNMEMEEKGMRAIYDNLNATETAVVVLEDVLGIKEYSEIQLLKLALFLRIQGRFMDYALFKATTGGSPIDYHIRWMKRLYHERRLRGLQV